MLCVRNVGFDHERSARLGVGECGAEMCKNGEVNICAKANCYEFFRLY